MVRYVINMDQISVFFFMNKNKMLELVSCKTIHMQRLTSDTKCATIAITITALSKSLTPLVTLKRAP